MSLVPNRMTHIFQPLDLTVNSWAKKFMKEKYAVWYASQIQADLEKGLAVDETDVKTPLITMKPLHAKWIMTKSHRKKKKKSFLTAGRLPEF